MDRLGGDEGESLIEILLAVAIMGIALAGVLGALGAATKASTVHRSQSDAQLSARDVTEQIKRQSFLPCTTLLKPAYTYTTPDSSTTIALTYKYDSSFVSTCPASGSQLQLITVTATPTDGLAAAASITFTKRRA